MSQPASDPVPDSVSAVWAICGLHVRSPIPLGRAPSRLTEPDLAISLTDPRPAPAALPGRLLGEHHLDGRLTEASYEHERLVSLLLPGSLVATYDVPRAQCTVSPDPSVGEALLQRLIAGPVLATWMILNHLPVLHASAVAIADRAVLFVGNSGAGKTTIAAALVGSGGVLIADDVCGLAERDDGWVCFPDAGLLRLREGSSALATMFEDDTTAAPAAGRTMVSSPPVESPVAVGAIVLPRIAQEVSQVTATRLQGTRSVLALLEHPRMGSLLGEEFSESLFRFASTLVAAVPVWELLVPRAAPVTPQIGAELHEAVTALLDACPSAPS